MLRLAVAVLLLQSCYYSNQVSRCCPCCAHSLTFNLFMSSSTHLGKYLRLLRFCSTVYDRQCEPCSNEDYKVQGCFCSLYSSPLSASLPLSFTLVHTRALLLLLWLKPISAMVTLGNMIEYPLLYSWISFSANCLRQVEKFTRFPSLPPLPSTKLHLLFSPIKRCIPSHPYASRMRGDR